MGNMASLGPHTHPRSDKVSEKREKVSHLNSGARGDCRKHSIVRSGGEVVDMHADYRVRTHCLRTLAHLVDSSL